MTATVILVHADDDVERLHRAVLSDAGYTVRSASTVTSAVEDRPDGSPNANVEVAVLFTSSVSATDDVASLRTEGVARVVVAIPAHPDAPHDLNDPVAIARQFQSLWQAGAAELLVAPPPSTLLRVIDDVLATADVELDARHGYLDG